MNVWFLARSLAAASLLLALTACGMFGASGEKTPGKGNIQLKTQSTQGTQQQQGSVIDQELKKQYQMYQEIIQYQREQDQKAHKQTEERYKKLKKQSEQPEKK